jgi:hypothetical protein
MRDNGRFWGARRRAGAALLGGTLLAAITGCGQQVPNAPGERTAQTAAAFQAAASIQGAFFPLAIDNRWHLTGTDSIWVVMDDGSPSGLMAFDNDVTRTIIGTETLEGRDYTVQEETLVQDEAGVGPDVTVSWIRYRQDGSGLYEADVDPYEPPTLDVTSASARVRVAAAEATGPPRLRLPARFSPAQAAAFQAAYEQLLARAAVIQTVLRTGNAASSGPAGGPLPHEITRLAYPLHPGAEWAIRTDPFFASTVEAVESVGLPAGRFSAYRIRIDSEFFGPNDRVHLWMGRSGQLRFRYHLEGAATDPDGNEIGVLVADHDEVLDEVSLVK